MKANSTQTSFITFLKGIEWVFMYEVTLSQFQIPRLPRVIQKKCKMVHGFNDSKGNLMGQLVEHSQSCLARR